MSAVGITIRGYTTQEARQNDNRELSVELGKVSSPQEIAEAIARGPESHRYIGYFIGEEVLENYDDAIIQVGGLLFQNRLRPRRLRIVRPPR